MSSPNQATNYEYDLLDNLVHITQGSQDRYFKYDSLSRLIREKQVEQSTNSSYYLSDAWNPGGTWTRKIEYNSSGLITYAYDARGVQTSYSYDDLHRVTQVSYSDSTPTAHYYYDSQTLPSGAPSYTQSNTSGRLLAMTYGSGTTGNYFAYDAMGRVVTQKQVTGSATYGLTYTYNYAGLLTSETYPSTRALTYSYDEGGRLSSLSDGTNTLAQSFTYAPHGGLTSETWGNSAVHTMTYNRRLQASQVKLALSSTVQQQYDYSYGTFNTSSGAVDTSKNNGQIGKIDATIGTTAKWNQGFSYDELGRLANVIEHAGSDMTTINYAQSYTYDRYGNRAQDANTTLGLPAVALTDYSASTNRFGSSLATYDSSGNITQDTKFRDMSFTYDANGRMTWAASNYYYIGSQTSVYDSAGQRVQTVANNVTRTMVYDIFGQLIADYLGSSGSTLERENIYRGGQLLAVYETGANCATSIADFVDAFLSGVGYSNSTYRANAIATLTQAQSQGQGQLLSAARNLGMDLFTNHYSNTTNAGDFVTALYHAYLGREPETGDVSAWETAINNGATWPEVRSGFADSVEFQYRIGGLCVSTSSGSAGYRYALSDVQGTTRVVMNNSGSSSVVIARRDYLPFGEEIWGVGGRTSTYAYGATDAVRRKYGLTERDDATGLDHTWWRKYENLSGRWTSPDPLSGGTSSPQSFNHYAYSENDPVNSIDPNGLCTFNINITGVTGQELTDLQTEITRIFSSGNQSVVFGHPDQARGGSMNLAVVAQFTGATLAHVRTQAEKNKINPNDVAGATIPGSSDSQINSRVLRNHDPSATGAPVAVVSLGTAYGRVGAHEVIQHGFLGQPYDSGIKDITTPFTSSVELYEVGSNRFNISAETVDALSKLCIPDPGVHESLHGGILSGGGPFIGFQVPIWRGHYDPFDNLRWLELWYEIQSRPQLQ